MFGIWRPSVTESIDGKPLATVVTDLFFEFPHDRLPNNKFLAFFLPPVNVAAMLIFYLVSKPLFKALAKKIDPKSDWFIRTVAFHNFSLAVFSGVVAYNSWGVVMSHYFRYGFWATYCDPDRHLWQDGLGAWSVIFYISKFYEFLDTWILILKGKPASLLQVYHHTGIGIAMWIGILSQSPWLQGVVGLNSVIHTLMYTYFFIKTLSPTTEIKAAKNLTRAQIGQFFTGIAISSPILVFGKSCDTSSSRLGLAFLLTYGVGLIALFMSFASRRYKKRS
jgi:hypothetical protein